MSPRGGGGRIGGYYLMHFLVASRDKCGIISSIKMELSDTTLYDAYQHASQLPKERHKKVETTSKETTKSDGDDDVIWSSHTWGCVNLYCRG